MRSPLFSWSVNLARSRSRLGMVRYIGSFRDMNMITLLSGIGRHILIFHGMSEDIQY